MKIISFLFLYLLCLLLCRQAAAQTGSIVWQKTIGGSDVDSLTSMSIGSDNTFVVCGASRSKKSGNKSDGNVGGYDYWVVKMDFSGNLIWNKTLGGAKDDVATAVICTSDGGYLVGGTSISDKSTAKSGYSFKKSKDYWVIKLDAGGNKTWDRTLGGTYTDNLTSLAEISPGKYIVGGYSFSDENGIKTSNNTGSENNCDYWMLVLGSDGTVLSQAVYGASGTDVLTAVAPVDAGHLYLAGYSYSLNQSGHKTTIPVGNNDFWILKSDLQGATSYEGDFGGNLSDYLTCMQLLPDQSFILGGYSNSPASGFKSGNFLGVTDYWIAKIKADGTQQWDKTYGGSLGDYLMSVQQTKDKGFIVGGYSNSNAGNSKSQNSKGGNDYWIIKTDSLGKMVWNKTIGGNSDDKLAGIYEISKNEFIVAGTSKSSASGDKTSGTVGNTGADDYWIMRLSSSSTSLNKTDAVPIVSFSSTDDSFTLSPNPAKHRVTLHYRVDKNKRIEFVVYSANGNEMMRHDLSSSAPEGNDSFDVSRFATGAYYVTMFEDGIKKVSKEFIKE